MRFLLFGPRFGWFRPGVSFGAEDFRRKPFRSAGEKLGGSFVYVVRGDHGLVKIGVSTNPTARLATLRNGSPFPISFAFIGATDGTNGFAIEREAHRVLSKYHTQGEWFDVSPEMAIATVWAAAASLGERLAGVDPSRVDDVIRLCAAGKPAQETLTVRILLGLIYMSFYALAILIMLGVVGIIVAIS